MGWICLDSRHTHTPPANEEEEENKICLLLHPTTAPHRPSSGTVPSGCKTPKLNILPGASRRLSSNLSPSGQSTTAPSPNQLREILADITKQVNNSPSHHHQHVFLCSTQSNPIHQRFHASFAA
ncbi:hypothetical protein H4Q26_006947 [Puccinia striiformis f. sp. tritici PST-130]|nr:hypothetical protein H4Q26_006947 [Puccinia striiformis f. sp. tritici PST-130]